MLELLMTPAVLSAVIGALALDLDWLVRRYIRSAWLSAAIMRLGAHARVAVIATAQEWANARRELSADGTRLVLLDIKTRWNFH